MGLRQFCLWLLVISLLLCLSQGDASIRFDAAADLLLRTTSMPGAGSLTRAIWVYRVSNLAADEAYWYMDNNGGAFSATYIGLLVLDTANTWGQESQIGTSQTGSGPTATIATWTHVTQVFDDTANVTNLYVNGVLQSGAQAPSQTGSTGTWNYEVLGNLSSGAGVRLDGRLSSVKIWVGAALTAAEIQAEMKYMVPIRRANLHSYSPLRTATELTSYLGGANWTASGTLTTEADPPVSVSPGNAFLSF